MNSNENVEFNNAHSSRVKRLYLTSIVEENILNRRDLRSIRKWCTKNNVDIIKDITGEFVIQQDFDLAYNSPIIKKLMGQYGPEWQSYYQYYLTDEVYKIVEIGTSRTEKVRYVPKGSIAMQHIK